MWRVTRYVTNCNKFSIFITMWSYIFNIYIFIDHFQWDIKWPCVRHVLVWQCVQCYPAPAWSSSRKRWWRRRLSPSCLRWPPGTWWRANLVLESMKRSGSVLFIEYFSCHDLIFFLSLTFIPGHILDLHLPHLCHVAQHREDHEPRHEAGQTVHQTCHDGITVEEGNKPC